MIRILLLLITLTAVAYAEDRIAFTATAVSDAGPGETYEIAGLLNNLTENDLSGLTLRVTAEKAEPLITASGDDRITIRKRSDTHVVTVLKPHSSIPVVLQWTVPEEGNVKSVNLSLADDTREVYRCMIALDTGGNQGSSDFMGKLIMIAAASAFTVWVLVYLRKRIKKRG